MIHDLPALVRARMQEIDREIEALQMQKSLRTTQPGWISRAAASGVGRLGSLLVTVGRRLEGYGFQFKSKSDDLQAAG